MITQRQLFGRSNLTTIQQWNSQPTERGNSPSTTQESVGKNGNTGSWDQYIGQTILQTDIGEGNISAILNSANQAAVKLVTPTLNAEIVLEDVGDAINISAGGNSVRMPKQMDQNLSVADYSLAVLFLSIPTLGRNLEPGNKVAWKGGGSSIKVMGKDGSTVQSTVNDDWADCQKDRSEFKRDGVHMYGHDHECSLGNPDGRHNFRFICAGLVFVDIGDCCREHDIKLWCANDWGEIYAADAQFGACVGQKFFEVIEEESPWWCAWISVPLAMVIGHLIMPILAALVMPLINIWNSAALLNFDNRHDKSCLCGGDEPTVTCSCADPDDPKCIFCGDRPPQTCCIRPDGTVNRPDPRRPCNATPDNMIFCKEAPGGGNKYV